MLRHIPPLYSKKPHSFSEDKVKPTLFHFGGEKHCKYHFHFFKLGFAEFWGKRTKKALDKFANGILGIVDTQLQLPKGVKGKINIAVAQIAQTDYGVEVDFPRSTDKPFSPEERMTMAKIIEAYINNLQPAQNLLATIWIRQSTPSIQTIPPLLNNK